MEYENNWGKQAYIKACELEERLDNPSTTTSGGEDSQARTDIASIKQEITQIKSKITQVEETPQQDVVMISRSPFGFAKFKSAQAQTRFLCKFKGKSGYAGELNLEYEYVSVNDGETGDLKLEFLLNDQVIDTQTVAFSSTSVKERKRWFFFSDGNFQTLKVRGTCLTTTVADEDEDPVATPCFLKNINYHLYAVQPEFCEEFYGARVEELNSESVANAGMMYIISNDAYGVHVSEFNPTTNQTTSLDNETTFMLNRESLAEVNGFKTAVMDIRNDSNALSSQVACLRCFTDGKLMTNCPPSTSSYYLSASTLPVWSLCGIWELYNSSKRGLSGKTTTLVANRYKMLYVGYNSSSQSVQVQGGRSLMQSVSAPAFDIETPISNIKDFYTVSNIFENSKNYSVMGIMQSQDDDLYFQAYNITDTDEKTGWLERVGDAIVVGNGHTCTAFCDESEIRFYYVRERKIYKSVLNLNTMQISSEVFVANGDYYKECSVGFWLRKEGVLTYVKKL